MQKKQGKHTKTSKYRRPTVSDSERERLKQPTAAINTRHNIDGTHVGAPIAPPHPDVPYLKDIFVGNTYYAIATFGTKIGSGQTSVNS